MSSSSQRKREPHSAPGDFYAVKDECLACGVPHVVAPELIGWVPDGRSVCYWKKQPETPGELERAFAVFDAQEAGCHRYAGHDPEILRRLGADSCDYPLPEQKVSYAPREMCLLPFEAPGILRRLWKGLTGKREDRQQ